jgi:hypothetical protein
VEGEGNDEGREGKRDKSQLSGEEETVRGIKATYSSPILRKELPQSSCSRVAILSTTILRKETDRADRKRKINRVREIEEKRERKDKEDVWTYPRGFQPGDTNHCLYETISVGHSSVLNDGAHLLTIVVVVLGRFGTNCNWSGVRGLTFGKGLELL